MPMHAMGLHSAMAIKRQRKRREEQKRARERRYSTQSTESGLTSPHNSMGSLADGGHRGGRRRATARTGAAARAPGDAVGSKVVTSVGMLHIGVVFLVLGSFLLVSGLLPEDINSWSSSITTGWFNELVVTGAFAFIVGVFLIVLNRVISQREEDDLNEYVQRQLTRSRSGHRLVRDVETGGLTTKQQARLQRVPVPDTCSASPLTPLTPADGPAPVHSPGGGPRSPAPQYLGGGGGGPFDAGEVPLSPLEPVLEEEVSEKGEEEIRAAYLSKEALSNGSTTGCSISPGSPSETVGLLGGRGASHHALGRI